ncbi:MAG TPA: acetyl-CoA C-acyltransferase, partial [Burkholderiales bacterium]|nr:acetyl-CoA C-acyltransferase [Burkholderiales bacterium]
EDSRNVARFAALLSGLPPTTPGVTVNRLCASGLQAVVDAARAVTCGEGDMYIAGGVESMSRAPYVFSKSDSPYSREVKMFDTTIGSRFPNPRVVKQFGNHSMPETGDNVAKDFGITRGEADQFALASQQKYAKAEAEGFYKGEIHAITLPSRKEPVTVSVDEHPRRDSSLDALSKLKPLFEGGIVTAGNASGVNDGAAALVIASKKWGDKRGKKPLARILSAASAGVEPRIMGVGPAYAIPRALERARLELSDMDIIEINEAFASQVLGCLKLMNVDFEDPRVNPNGGAIAIGHPLGASGARLALTTTRELQQSGGRYAAVSLCIGVGQGLAVILERVQ